VRFTRRALTALSGIGSTSAAMLGISVEILPLADMFRGMASVASGADGIARRLIVKAWYPRDMQAEHPEAASFSPVVFFNAGWAGSSDGHFGLIQALVARGFVVVTVDHRLDLDEYDQFLDFSSRETFDRTKTLADRKARQFASDNSAVLDVLGAAGQCSAAGEVTSLLRRLDHARIGIVGYSFGGAVAAQTAWQDPRFKAALNLDGWLFADAAARGVVQPFMEISDDTPPGSLDEPAQDLSKRLIAELNQAHYRQLRANMISHGGYYLVVGGANHESFVDVTHRSIARQIAALLPGSQRPGEIIDAYVVGFCRRYVAGVADDLIDRVPPPYREVRLEYAQPPVARLCDA
jgi:predicted dienelactone hydrolase